jgi:hypothetical protein
MRRREDNGADQPSREAVADVQPSASGVRTPTMFLRVMGGVPVERRAETDADGEALASFLIWCALPGAG